MFWYKIKEKIKLMNKRNCWEHDRTDKLKHLMVGKGENVTFTKTFMGIIL